MRYLNPNNFVLQVVREIGKDVCIEVINEMVNELSTSVVDTIHLLTTEPGKILESVMDETVKTELRYVVFPFQ